MAVEASEYVQPEDRARMRIDQMLSSAGWSVQDYKAINLYAATGVAVRELVTNAGPADYVLFVNRQAVGAIEAKKQGTTLAGVEWQTVKYQTNVPDELPAVKTGTGHLPFGYESTGDETWFTCRFDPEPTARRRVLVSPTRNHLCDGRGPHRRPRRLVASPGSRHRPARALEIDSVAARCATRRHPQPRTLASGQQAASAHPDGDGLGQDVRCGEHC